VDVLVLASTEPEPYGLVLTEALSTGTRVVATDAGGPREILATAHAGAGRLVPPRDADALADAITATVADAGATNTEARRARKPLRDPGPSTVAEVLREVAAGPR
jgi:glycosyltransferase involved in cell wall biosynthesis